MHDGGEDEKNYKYMFTVTINRLLSGLGVLIAGKGSIENNFFCFNSIFIVEGIG